MTVYLTKSKLQKLVSQYLQQAKVSENNANITADALIQAQCDGQIGHGLSRLISYAQQAQSGKVNGFAKPTTQILSPAACRINAQYGFSFPALKIACQTIANMAKKQIIATAAIFNSHHSGTLTYHVEYLANQGLIGLMFCNSPQAIAPWGGHKGTFGTNPIALAAPRENQPPIVIDTSLSRSARGKVMVAEQNGETIPKNIALDENGNPTQNPKEALKGTMLPIGNAKGAALAMLVEILAAALTGANLAFQASSFLTPEGEPPAVGQLLIAINPNPLSQNQFNQQLNSLIQEITQQQNTRIPGDNRLKNRQQTNKNGIPITKNLYQILTQN